MKYLCGFIIAAISWLVALIWHFDIGRANREFKKEINEVLTIFSSFDNEQNNPK